MVCIRWGSDSFCFGFYLNVVVGVLGDDYDIMVDFVNDRFFFVGEVIICKYLVMMYGVFLSGYCEVVNMVRVVLVRLDLFILVRIEFRDL